MSLIGLSNNIRPEPNLKSTPAKENINEIKIDSAELADIQRNLKSKTTIDNADLTRFKIETRSATIFKMFNDWNSNEPLKDKLSVVGKGNIIHKSTLADGESEIKYRFKTNVQKTTYDPVSVDPKEYGKDKTFFYVNGIQTERKAAINSSKDLSKITGQNFKTLYNPTAGTDKSSGMIKDLMEVAKERLNDTKIDKVSQDTGTAFYKELYEGKNLKIVAHSQGAAITADALNFCSKMIEIEVEKANKNLPYDDKLNPQEEAKKRMSKVEVITMGGAASQDKFPNVKLVEIVNPKDLIPKIGGGDTFTTYVTRKTAEVGKVSYVKNPDKVYHKIPFISKNIDHVVSGISQVGKGIGSALRGAISGDSSPLDYHKIDSGKNAYLNQNNVRSLLYNFGRQDLQTIK